MDRSVVYFYDHISCKDPRLLSRVPFFYTHDHRLIKATGTAYDKTGQSMIGVRFEAKLQKITNPVQLLVQSVYEVEHWIYYVFDSFHMIFAGRVSADDISGPVGIVTTIDQTVEQAAPAGNTVVAMVLVNFAILLSANLGVMNLLPLPALDGGRLVFLIMFLSSLFLISDCMPPGGSTFIIIFLHH